MPYPKAEHLWYQSDGVLVVTQTLFVWNCSLFSSCEADRQWELLPQDPLWLMVVMAMHRPQLQVRALQDPTHVASLPLSLSLSHTHTHNTHTHTQLFLLCSLSGIGIYSASSCWLTRRWIRAFIRNHRAKRIMVCFSLKKQGAFQELWKP